jgi:cation diffusion facilitator family transporter
MESQLVMQGEKEKRAAALTSVFAAVGLTTMKIVVGILTGSLGILAEAAHSALDLVAALVTYFAVKSSGKPADEEHRYGHGKVENLSALFETVLLLITAGWIIFEAIDRLFFNPVDVAVSIWSFIVMGISIMVDITRSRILFRAAKKYNSQALEADALHFSTDIWSSSVVIFGLLCVLISQVYPNFAFLVKADAIAAIIVAMIVIYVSMNLGKRTVKALLDTAPIGMAERIQLAVEAVPGVTNCHNLRIRDSGPNIFIDAHVLVDGRQSLQEVHQLTDRIELEIHKVLPNADVTVHPEPVEISV